MKNAKEFRYDVLILERHLDTFGHVNNATYLELYEEARWDYIEANGFGLKKIMQDKIGPVLLEVNLKFRREIKNRERITITSKARALSGKILTLDQVMLKEDGQIASLATFTVGVMDLKARKLITPPKEWLGAVGIELD